MCTSLAQNDKAGEEIALVTCQRRQKRQGARTLTASCPQAALSPSPRVSLTVQISSRSIRYEVHAGLARQRAQQRVQGLRVS
eukprot:6172332-Pleurochrysis_carterae.AAC.1